MDIPVIYGQPIPSESDSIVYVLDVSCSMEWDEQTYVAPDGTIATGPRIARAKAELVQSIMQLSENFSFDVVTYDCSVNIFSPTLVEANDANKSSALAWIQSQQPDGATATGPATAAGLSFQENMAVVLLTDGAPNCGAFGADPLQAHRQIIRTANTQGATIDVFGIAASGSYRGFCQAVAGDSGGNYFDVP